MVTATGQPENRRPPRLIRILRPDETAMIPISKPPVPLVCPFPADLGHSWSRSLLLAPTLSS
jgi:hypothetical protein